MQPTYGDYDESEVDGLDTLKERIANAKTAEDWSFILKDYISFGNTKIADNVAIFNLNAATDCPNADTEACQVPWNQCYAHKAEKMYKQSLPYRRRQSYLWDNMSAKLWADAFRELVSRKRKTVDTIRFSEAGDFRSKEDIDKADEIAGRLSEFAVYTYSASHYLDWSDVEHMTVNQSNDFDNFGDRLYTAVETESDIPESGIQCPFEATDGEIKCGECQACITKEGPDVYISLH